MHCLIRTASGAICGLMLLCGFGVYAYAVDSCVTEVLQEETPAHAKPEDLTFELQLQKEKDSIRISNPQEFFNGGGVLKKDFSHTLTSEQLDKLKAKSHEVKRDKGLEVQAKNGQKYCLSKGKTFQLVLPDTKSPAANYTAIIPAGKKLKQKDSAPGEYVLLEDLAVNVTPPKNFQVTLELDRLTRIERIPDPGASSIGTTLTVEPKRAPPGGYINLTVKKSEFDFGKAQFYVCLRLRGQGKEFFPSQDVELQKVLTGGAVLQAQIPEKIDGLGGVYFAQSADLVVVASIPGDKVQRAEVMTQEFKVSSRWTAALVWLLAFVIPWIFAAVVKGYGYLVEAAQKNLTTTESELNEAKQKRDRAKVAELTTKVANQRQDLASAMAASWWRRLKIQFNPIWMVSGKVGGASLSLAQILLWSILVFSASLYVLVVSGKLLDLTNDVLVLLGIAGGASVIAKITTATKDAKGQALAGEIDKEPKWLDLIQSEGRPDIYKFQMALFTVLAAVFVAGKIYGTLEFPLLPAGLLTLIGISNGVYLSAKATSKTAFEELAEIDRERQEANKNLEKLKNEASRLEESLSETKKKLEEAQKAKNQAEIDELTPKVKEKEQVLQKAKAAEKEAQTSFDKLQKNFEDKKKQALQ